MNQEKDQNNFKKVGESIRDKPVDLKPDLEKISRLEKGFLFSISASDLLIIFAAILTIAFMQAGPKINSLLDFKYQSQISKNIPSDPTDNLPTPFTSTESSDLIDRQIPEATKEGDNQATQSTKNSSEFNEKPKEEKVNCKLPRPEICTLECIIPPPYICGSDAKQYCTSCQACSNSQVEWYSVQPEPCTDITP